MAQISRLSRLIGGIQRGVDLTANTLVVQDIQIGGLAGTVLTKTILDRLVSLQNGSNVDATYHVHNDTTVPYTRSDGSKTDIQAGSDDVGSAINDLDDDKISKAGLVAFTANQPMGTHKLTGLSAGSSAGDSVRYEQAILTSGANAFAANQPMGGFKLTGLAAGSGAGDSVRYEQAILASGVNAFAADQSMGTHKLTNLSDPSAGQDAATKAYVDAVALGLAPKKAVSVATTANITLSGEQTIDGVLTSASRVLVKNQTLPENNGIYVSASGSWTRSTDMDSLTPIDEVNGAWVPVQLGTVNAGRIYVQYGTVATLGTDAINWEFYNPLAALVGGDMITNSGSTFSVDLATVSGLESTNPGNVAGQLRIKLEASNPSLKFTGSNELAAKLDAAGAIASGASGLATQVDGTTVEISSNALRVKANGINGTHIRLANAQTLRARNAANSADVDLLHLDSSDVLQFDTLPQANFTPTNPTDLVNKAYADSLSSGVVTESVVAGESFSANTTYAVRWAVSGETAGRVYKADDDTTSADKFHVVGMLKVGSALTAGQSATLTKFGSLSQASGDTAFGGTDIGKPVYLTTAGAWSVTPSSTALHANVIIGYVKTTTVMDVKSLQIQGVN